MVGPLKLVLYASSSALETDFYGRLSDVFPDGKAVQLQSGMVRTRYRGGGAAPITPGDVYCFEIDMWATANRFVPGHRLRLDISSADFPSLSATGIAVALQVSQSKPLRRFFTIPTMPRTDPARDPRPVAREGGSGSG